MGTITDPDAADAVVQVARVALTGLRETEFWKIPNPDLLVLAKQFEHLGRLACTAQIHLAGEIDTRKIAESHGCTSTASLLRQTLTISAPDARARVHAARAVLPQDLPTGGETPPVLPLLGAALAAGVIGAEQTRTIVSTMNKLPATLDPDTRDTCQQVLVENGISTEPKPFADFARAVALTCDPDGTPDQPNPSDRVELTLGARNPSTGMTRFAGQLDDEGVEVLGQAIDGLATPHPAADGTPDPRSAPTRRGQALKEVLHRYLNHGDAPVQGGERPHVTVTMDFEDLKRNLGAAVLEHGGPISAAQARMLACDAKIIPRSWAPRPRSWTSEPRAGCSRRRSAGRSPCGTGAAPGRAATDHRPGATATTSNIGPTAAPAATATAACCVVTTIPRSTGRTGRSGSPPTVSPNSSPHPGWTRPENPDATPCTTSTIPCANEPGTRGRPPPGHRALPRPVAGKVLTPGTGTTTQFPDRDPAVSPP